ncbi:hypothetical protein AC578_1764 [Pseudocercospora eumusae]|uniref:Uncharacterized protein n=1 Tax=Pseudocercospora eumusae TaxID=321146 RepID=A0A139H7K8_9PEZI|nr:hypothetical protein AC578_1764 [Pseudocercospora eumusae]
MHGTYNQINKSSKMFPANLPAFCQMARAGPSGPDAKILGGSMSGANSSESDDPFGIKALEKAGIILKEARSTPSRPDSAISVGRTDTSTKASTWPFMSGDSGSMSSSSSFTSRSSARGPRKTSKFKETFDWNNDTPIDMSSMPAYPSLDECWEQDQQAYDTFKKQRAASFSREEHYRASESFAASSVSDYESESEAEDPRASQASTYSDSVYSESVEEEPEFLDQLSSFRRSDTTYSSESEDSLVHQNPFVDELDSPPQQFSCDKTDSISESADSLVSTNPFVDEPDSPPQQFSCDKPDSISESADSIVSTNPFSDIWAVPEVQTFTLHRRVVSGIGRRPSGPLEPFPAFDVTEMAGKRKKRSWRRILRKMKKCM